MEATKRMKNGTPPSGPGRPCFRRSQCSGELVCLPSETCGCPQSAPVMVLDINRFICLLPRRLDELCQVDEECRHDNEHARCLDSVCRCPPLFYATKATSLCLPGINQLRIKGR
ncbi:uncharacterized protein LOC144152375 [Haemaphysalis longicornis]